MRLRVSLILRRLGITFALAFVLTCVLAIVDRDEALLFLPIWLVLFLVWPYLGRQLGFESPKVPAPAKPRPPMGRRFIVTAVLAVSLAFGLAYWVHESLFGPAWLVLWLALFYGWPLLCRGLPFLRFLTESRTASANPVPKRPLWLRMVRGTLAVIGAIGLGIFVMSLTVIVPLSLSHHRARKVHDSIRIGMTVPEVLQTAKDCDIFQASSDFPYDEKTDGDNIPAMGLVWGKDGIYRTYDLATRQNLTLSESEAIERLRAKLHDGYSWRFRYTYLNMTPQHVSFSVVFGPDGRVTEVKPVYGWD